MLCLGKAARRLTNERGHHQQHALTKLYELGRVPGWWQVAHLCPVACHATQHARALRRQPGMPRSFQDPACLLQHPQMPAIHSAE